MGRDEARQTTVAACGSALAAAAEWLDAAGCEPALAAEGLDAGGLPELSGLREGGVRAGQTVVVSGGSASAAGRCPFLPQEHAPSLPEAHQVGAGARRTMAAARGTGLAAEGCLDAEGCETALAGA